MIDTVTFVNEAGAVLRPYQDLGILMKHHYAAFPSPKIYRVELDGADGDLDMTEWAGDVKYQPRDVTIAFRDMSAKDYRHIVNYLLGQRVKITFSEEPEYYFIGRCEQPDNKLERRVMDMEFVFTCDPFRLRHIQTIRTITGSGILQAERMPALPVITAPSACTVTLGETEFVLTAGENSPAGFVVTRYPQAVTVSDGKTLIIQWRDGAF